MEEKYKHSAVIDSSFMLCYLLPDEQQEIVQEQFDNYKSGTLQLISLPLFAFEIANGLHAAVLSKRVEISVAEQLLQSFLQLPVVIEQTGFPEAFQIAQKYRISVYDASYILLAQSKNLPLLTLDKRLQQILK